jgi:hypothetical protein
MEKLCAAEDAGVGIGESNLVEGLGLWFRAGACDDGTFDKVEFIGCIRGKTSKHREANGECFDVVLGRVTV